MNPPVARHTHIDTISLQSSEALTEPSAKRKKVASNMSTTQLDGVQLPEAVGVEKITIVDEFKQLTNQSIIVGRYKQLTSILSLSGTSYVQIKVQRWKIQGCDDFDSSSNDYGVHWKKLCGESIEGLDRRNLLQAIQKDAMDYTLNLEVRFEIKTQQQASKTKALPTLHSLGTRYNAIKKQ